MPYVPVPSAQPTTQGLPGLPEGASPDAFGAGVGSSVSNLGRAISHSADELFNRAIALQQVENDTNARNADIDFSMKLNTAREKFHSLEGKAAVDAYPAYQKEIEELRIKSSEGLNPAAKRIYDSTSRRTAVQTFASGASHSATQFKAWANGSNEGAIKLAQVNAGNNWNNPEAFAENIKTIEENVKTYGIGKGWSDVQTEAFKNEQVAKAWYEKLKVRSITDPFGARAEYEANKEVFGPYRVNIEQAIASREASVGSKQIADGQVNGSGDYYDRLGRKESGGNLYARAKTSSAEGLFQFTASTWANVRNANPELNLPAAVREANLEQQTAAVKAFTEANRKRLTSAGLEDTQANLYMAHFLGAGGAVTFLKGMQADPGQPGTNLVSADAANANRSIFFNADGSPRSAAMVFGRLTSSFMGPGPLSKDSPASWLRDATEAGAQIARIMAPDNPQIEELTVNAIKNRYNTARQTQRYEEQANLLDLQYYVAGSGDPKKALTDYNDIYGNPQMYEKFQMLPPPKQKALLRQIDQQAKASPPDTPELAQNLGRVLNMATSVSGRQDEFLELDPWKLLEEGKITRSGAEKIASKQRQVAQRVSQDAKMIQHAISLSRPYLKSANVEFGSDEFVQFQGAMNAWLMDQQEAKKIPNDKEIQDKAASLVARSGGYKVFGFDTGIGARAPFEPPKDFINEITPLFKARHPEGRAPTMQEITTMYQNSLRNPNWRDGLR